MSWNLVKGVCFVLPLSFGALGASQASAEVWGAVSIANNGAYSSVWNSSSSESATTYARANCPRVDSQDCNGTWVKGSAWIAGVYCHHTFASGGGRHWGITRSGNTAKQAIVKAYKDAIAKDVFAKEDCKLRVLIAGDGSHLKYKQ
jgi:hypothetical protein